MKFLEAKKILREQGYNITPMGPSLGPSEYEVWRCDVNDRNQFYTLKWRFTAEDIKAGVYRAMNLAGKI